tara:strand:+ start:803 stop:988 length:186 start_codon:yes stop_codon:yes gene_type:complete
VKSNRKKLLKEHYDREWQEQFISPIPKHLTPEEREQWEKELEWERQEHERRKKEGYYPYQD